MITNTSIYDEQAISFDKRAGLTLDQCKQITEAIEAFSRLKQNDILVEIGCGTGQIGSLLAPIYGHYVGIDLSLAMLEQFKNLDTTHNTSLIQADCNQTWPVADHSASTIFSSRAIHWISVEHVISEVHRIAGKGDSLLLIGRIERTPDSWESKLRKQCHRLLKQHQLTPLDGVRHLKILSNEFSKRKAEVLTPFIVNHWNEKRNPLQSLENWVNKPGLGGTNPTNRVKQNILSQLKIWAYEEFGSKLPTEIERHYVLYGIKLAV